MLRIFPTLLVFSLVAPFLLRLATGPLFLSWSIRTLSSERRSVASHLSNWNIPGSAGAIILGIIEGIVGILLVVGLYTQVAALIGMILSALFALLSRKEMFVGTNALSYLLVALICFSLMFSGAGFFAFDLPL